MSSLSISNYFPFSRVKITEQSVYREEKLSSLIKLVPDKRYVPLCHECGSEATTVHSKDHLRILRDLNIADSQTWLQVEYRKIWCENCGGVRVEQLSFADASKRVTQRLARYVYDLCKVMTVQDVAEHLDLDPKTVKNIDKTFLEQEYGVTDCDNLRILAIDEIAVRKGHNYMTVVMDYMTGKIIWMGENRDKETLDAFFRIMTKKQKKSIEAVAMDMWEPFINRVKHHIPQAKIVFDFFHVVQSFGKVIDEVRKQEYEKANNQDKQVLKGSKYLLLMNEENLKDSQKEHLENVLELNSTLNTLYVLKDHLKLIYFYSDRDIVKQTLDQWCDMAATLKNAAVDKFINKLRKHQYGIIEHADYPIGTSILEGANNKIKVIKRKAYGFHDMDYFTLKVKQAFDN
ncbi:MAG: ISL3 family transposase [Bacteroidales bacterium]|nr:ISL3 family transposase [Bacteroidales bacterium]